MMIDNDNYVAAKIAAVTSSDSFMNNIRIESTVFEHITSYHEL